MAEILVNSQSPVYHQIFWNGDISDSDSFPTVKLYDVTQDPLLVPLVNPLTLLATLVATKDENNPGTYFVNIPYAFTNRNKTLRLIWEYSVGGVQVFRPEEVFVVTPYVDFGNACGCLGISIDSSDPNYKSYRDLIRAEKYARKQIEEYTGQNFYLYDDTYVVYGHESDILSLPSKINQLYTLSARDTLLLDEIQKINNWNFPVIISESGYAIRINRAGLQDNTVYVANGMVPPSIHDYSGVFKSGIPYRVYGRFGWDKVPDNVELAAIELMKDYFSKDTMWRNKYVKSKSTFDWDFEYTGSAYTGTGNAYADNLLADYVLTIKAEII